MKNKSKVDDSKIYQTYIYIYIYKKKKKLVLLDWVVYI